MKKLSRTLSGSFAAALLTGTLVSGASAADFQQTQIYTPGRFTDVISDSWYEGSVKSVYELGLMKGTSSSTFNPTGKFTLAEAITIAANLHSIYTNTSFVPSESGPWYQGAVDYCIRANIITPNQFSDYTRPATRSEMAGILVSSLPDSEWAAKNDVASLPDVTERTPFRNAIFKFYNAGILSGADQYGTFHPNANITRAEVSAIVARCAKPESRLTLHLLPKPAATLSDALDTFTAQTGCLNGQLCGSGFFYDLDSDNVDEMILLGYRDNVGDGLPGFVYSVYDEQNGTLLTRIDQEFLTHSGKHNSGAVGIDYNHGTPRLVSSMFNGYLNTETGHIDREQHIHKFYTPKTVKPESIVEQSIFEDGDHWGIQSRTHNGVTIDYNEYCSLVNFISWNTYCHVTGPSEDNHSMTLSEMKEVLNTKPLSINELTKLINIYLQDHYTNDGPNGGFYHVFEDEAYQNGATVSYILRYAGAEGPANVLSGDVKIDLKTMTGTIERTGGYVDQIDLSNL